MAIIWKREKSSKRGGPQLEAEDFRPLSPQRKFPEGHQDYGTEAFKTYNERIRRDVTFLTHNLREKYHYADQGAKEVCIYVIDNDLAKRFAAP